MAKGYETREFIMPQGVKTSKEAVLVRNLLAGRAVKRDEYITVMSSVVRGRVGYLSKGGQPYDQLEAAKSFAAHLKAGTIRELK